MKETNTRCDNCETILTRQQFPDDKENLIDHITIHGSICQQKVDAPYFLYATDYKDEILSFCNVTCFGEWVNDRTAERKKSLETNNY